MVKERFQEIATSSSCAHHDVPTGGHVLVKPGKCEKDAYSF